MNMIRQGVDSVDNNVKETEEYLNEDTEILEYFLHKAEFIKDLVVEASNDWNEYNKILCNVD